MKKQIMIIWLMLFATTGWAYTDIYRTLNGTPSWFDANGWDLGSNERRIPRVGDIAHINVPNHCEINEPNKVAICSRLIVGETIDPFGTLHIKSPFVCFEDAKIYSGGVILVDADIECIVGGQTYVSYPDGQGGGGSLLLGNEETIWRSVGGTRVGYNGTIGGIMECIYGTLKTPHLYLDNGSLVNCKVEWP